jgi:hypothetical protein
MGGNSYDTRGEASGSTYWRRRFIVLAIGLVVFGLGAWGLSSALAVKSVPASRVGQAGVTGRPTSTDSMSRSGTSGDGHRTGSSHSGGTGAGQSAGDQSQSAGGHGHSGSGHGQAASGGHPAGHHGQAAGGGHLAGSAASGGGKSGAGQAAGHGTILPAFCGRREIVLSVYAGQAKFAPKDSPTFELSIVSTQPAECTFNIGSAHLALVIKEGPTTIWDSADCAAGTPSLDAALGRGVPTVVTVTWNRKTSAPGCSSRTMRVPPGVYTAYAVDGTLASQPVSIRLS